MPRAQVLDTENTKKLLGKLYLQVKSGDIDTKTGNCLNSVLKSILYANQLQNTEDRIALEQATLDKLEKIEAYIKEHPDREIDLLGGVD